MGKLISIEEAVLAKGQHQAPCQDCPWRRDSLPGWLGGGSPQEFAACAHSDELILCHTLLGAQCAGAAIYRRNVAKYVEPPMLRLAKDETLVFSTRTEFETHHTLTKGSQHEYTKT